MRNEIRPGAPWAIMPQALQGIIEEVRALESDGAALAKTAAQLLETDPLEWGPADKATVVDGVAIIPVEGPIMRRRSFFSQYFGGTGINIVEAKVRDALANPAVAGILLDINSPGGVVNGTNALADLIYAARARKPIVAYAGGLIASAAYWIGSAAHALIVDPTAEVGSIGVVAVHADFSKMLDEYGIKTTVLRAGKFKALGNPYEPLSDEARAIFQSELDAVYNVFVGAVARNRAADPSRVSGEMADGKIFVGQAAVAIGLADQIGTIQTAVESIHARAGRRIYPINGGAAAAASKGKTEMEIKTVQDMRAAFPDLVAQVETDARADMESAITDARAEGRADAVALVAAVFGEDDGKRFDAIAASGITAEQFRIANPDAGKKRGDREALERLLATGAENPGANTGGESQPDADFMALVDEHVAKHGGKRTDAMVRVAAAHPAAHRAYLRRVNSAA